MHDRFSPVCTRAGMVQVAEPSLEAPEKAGVDHAKTEDAKSEDVRRLDYSGEIFPKGCFGVIGIALFGRCSDGWHVDGGTRAGHSSSSGKAERLDRPVLAPHCRPVFMFSLH